MSILMALVTAVLFGCGTWLLMQRRLTRIIIGIGLLGHGANLLLVAASGPRGRPPIIGSDEAGTVADPLPHALALTAIVITFGITMFLLALGFRSWQISGDDAVEDDIEDRYIATHDELDTEGKLRPGSSRRPQRSPDEPPGRPLGRRKEGGR